MKKLAKQITALLVVIPITVSGCSRTNNNELGDRLSSINLFGNSNSNEDNSESSHKRNKKGTDFNNMSYTHTDMTEYNSLIDEISSLCNDSDNSNQVLKDFDSMYSIYNSMDTNCTLASIHNSLDVTDQYYIDEYNYSYETYMNMYNSLIDTATIIINSNCSDAAREYWGDELFESFSSATSNSEVSALLLKEKELLNQYTELIYNEDATSSNTNNNFDNDNNSNDNNINGHDNTPGILDNGSDDNISDYNDELKKKCELVGPIYIELINVRNSIAKAYNYKTYAEYSYVNTYYRDYTPTDVLNLCNSVKRKIVPLFSKIYSTRNQAGFDELDSYFSKVTDRKLLEMLSNYLGAFDESFVETFNYMKKYNLYDIEGRENKASGGFTTYINGYSSPFLFNNPDEDFYDLMSLEHEFGHFYEYYITSGNVAASTDISEIYSQALELMYTNHYSDMLSEKYVSSAIDYTIVQRLDTIIEGCLYDEFQQKVYSMENPTVEKINQLYCSLCKEYGLIDSNDPITEAYDWVEVTHNFTQPMYYISYAISAVPAFELWEISLKDFDKAADIYVNMVTQGSSLSYTELLEENNLLSPFNPTMLDNLESTLKKRYGL